jgi:hypothetical protein
VVLRDPFFVTKIASFMRRKVEFLQGVIANHLRWWLIKG